MICPFCGKEMDHGVVQTDARLSWNRQKKMINWPDKGEVQLGFKALGWVSIPADICRDCKKVIVDYSESNWKEG